MAAPARARRRSSRPDVRARSQPEPEPRSPSMSTPSVGDRRAPGRSRGAASARARQRTWRPPRSCIGMIAGCCVALIGVGRRCCSCSRCRSRSAPGITGAPRPQAGGGRARPRRATASPTPATILGVVGVVVGVVGAIVLASSCCHRRRSISTTSRRELDAPAADLPALASRRTHRALMTAESRSSKQYLMTAGPTPRAAGRLAGDGRADALPPRARLRSSSTSACLDGSRGLPDGERRAGLRRQRARGAMESAVANLVRPGDAGRSSARRGKFGERWIQLSEAYGAESSPRAGLGRAARPRRHRPAARARTPASRSCSPRSARPRPASSTTSRRSPRSPRRHGAILVVDAVSGLGAAELRQDEWDVDVVVAGSQKALMCPPGLAFASASPSARSSSPQEQPRGRYYFDWGKTREEPGKARRQPVHAGRILFLGARRRARA